MLSPKLKLNRIRENIVSATRERTGIAAFLS